MTTFHIADMTCGRCASAIARALAQVDRQARVEISMEQKRVTVSSEASDSALAEAIQQAGYTAERVTAPASRAAAVTGGCCCSSRQPERQVRSCCG